MLRRLLILVSICLVVVTGCSSASRYSEEAIQAVKALLHNSSDDAKAIQILDKALAARGATTELVDRVAVAWSGHLTSIRDDILKDLTATPDTAQKVQSFVVGSACDVFADAPSWPGGAPPESHIRDIVKKRQQLSQLPAIAGMPDLIDELVKEIQSALRDGDLGEAAPGVAQTFACEVAAG